MAHVSEGMMHIVYCVSVSGGLLTKRVRQAKPTCLCVCFIIPTFQPDHQRHLELQLSTGFGDAVGDDCTVDNPSEDVDQDGLNLENKRMNK